MALVRAAEYVRMSTEHQKYSTDLQSETIRHYASQRGLTIVRTYADEGRSGLNIEGRVGLQSLLADVEGGSADFSVVVVYDISRWGRFQDSDEAASYEYRCRAAGVHVAYCAEQFENDGSIGSDVQKVVKRRMAAEYSRDLSIKVHAGQCNLIRKGFRQGGPPGFGLRRQLMDESGNSKGELHRKQHKSIQTDRVVLVPGPEAETDIVRSVYHSFVADGRTESEIAAGLNEQGIFTDLGHSWTKGTVHQLLINEKYIGNNVWNRRSFKLKRRRVQNEPALWVRADGVFEAVVDRALFEAAAEIIRARSLRLTDEEMLEALRRLLAHSGSLSGLIIDEAENCPSSSAYQGRFGNLLRAYELVGYTPERDYRYVEINQGLRRLYPEIVSDVVTGIERAGAHVIRNPENDLLTVNEEFSVSVVVVRCLETRGGSLRWSVRLDRGLFPDLTVAVRMDRSNIVARDYLILPSFDMDRQVLRLGEHNGLSLDAYLFDSLDPLFEMAERVSLSEVA
ncbi:recombinase family protein [Tardiphaga sp.]|uniref:recombinase family protein n=1 Tax=Tardiphaga sp. TaxID=1926292 RepID=UPI00352A23A4